MQTSLNHAKHVGVMVFCLISASFLTPYAWSDYLCIYKAEYMLKNDGTINFHNELDKGKRFTITTDGKTAGEIHGSYEVFHDGEQTGYAWHGIRKDNDILQYRDPEAYKQKVFISKVERRRQIPERLWIEEFAEGEKKPFLLSQNGFMSTGLCEKL